MKRHDTFVRGIARVLARRGLIKQEDVDILANQFSQSSHTAFEYFLLDEGLLTKDQLLPVLAEYYEVPAVDVTGYLFDFRLIRSFPKDVMLRNVFIPQEIDEDVIIVITNNPDDENLAPLIEEHVSYDVQFRVGLERDICDAVKEYYDPAEGEEEAFEQYYDTQDDEYDDTE